MAQHEHDRENLLREATALVERIELRVEGFAEPVIVGFRRGGEASVFFGVDPVYQFNARSELRRAFRDGRVIKAENGRLVELERRRDEARLQWVRNELDDKQTELLLANCREQLGRLAAQLDAGLYQIVDQVPVEGDSLSLVRRWLAGLPTHLAVAQRPNVNYTGSRNP